MASEGEGGTRPRVSGAGAKRPLSRRRFLARAARGSGRLGFLAGLTQFAGCGTTPPRAQRQFPPIVLVTLDTTRADHLGCYGYGRPTSPHIDRLAREAVVYRRAIAPGTWTFPSHASLFTGKFATSHGARFDPAGQLQLNQGLEKGQPSWDQYRVRTIAADERTLAALLGDHGYATCGVVAGPWLKKVFGLSKGFVDYDDNHIGTVNGRLAEDVTDAALRWLASPVDGPRFLFANYFDPHGPLVPPAAYARKFLPPTDPSAKKEVEEAKRRIALYDAEINYMDDHVGRLLDGLRQRDLFTPAWIIITADHGELLGEHGQTGHGDIPLQGVIRVPMIVKPPGPARKTGAVDRWVQLTDVLPMILDALGIDLPGSIQGQAPPEVNHPIITESRTLAAFMEYGHWLSVIRGTMKYIWNSKGHNMLFDLASDPAENINLIERRADEAGAMGDSLVEYLAGLPGPGDPSRGGPVDDETLRSLKSLGYVE